MQRKGFSDYLGNEDTDWTHKKFIHLSHNTFWFYYFSISAQLEYINSSSFLELGWMAQNINCSGVTTTVP